MESSEFYKKSNSVYILGNMLNVKAAIENNEKWAGLRSYVELIEANQDINPNIAIDGAKSLLESVAKTVLADRGVSCNSDPTVGQLIKMATRSIPSFILLEAQDADAAIRIVSGLESVSSSIGALRNRHGSIGHGKDLHGGRELDKRLASFAIASVDNLAGFLMEAHLAEPGIKRIRYEDHADFNELFDERQDEIEIEGILISPSRALFDQDVEAYKEIALAFGQKEVLIDELEGSGSFATTHNVIVGLSKHGHFSDQQIGRLVEIATINSQVGKIIEDKDVHSFYDRIIDGKIGSMDKGLRVKFWMLFGDNIPIEAASDMDDIFPVLQQEAEAT